MKIVIDHDHGTRECPSCATDVPANSNHCPICGYEFPVMPPARAFTVWVVALVLLVILLGSWLFRVW